MKMADRTESRYDSMWQGQSRLRHIGDIHYIAYKQITLSYLSVIWGICRGDTEHRSNNKDYIIVQIIDIAMVLLNCNSIDSWVLFPLTMSILCMSEINISNISMTIEQYRLC